MKPRGFANHDLLYVMAIFFGIIVPITFQLLRPVREYCRRSNCQSNLTQISLALKQYTRDYDNFLPRYDVGGAGARAGEYTTSDWVQSLQAYTKSPKVFQCPSEHNRVGTDYFYSRRLSGLAESKISRPFNTVLVLEGIDTASGALATATAPVTQGDPPAYARHFGGSNYAFADGHIKWLLSSQAPGNQPASNGGFTFNF